MDIHRCFSSRKRKQVRRACLNCQKAHSGCGEQRPCPRCVKRKEEHKCVDAPRRKRKDLPLEEGADSDGYEPASPELVIPQPTELSNKRKRKLSSSLPPSVTSKVETSHAGQHSDDDDWCNDDDSTYYHKTHQQHPALVVRNNKRPRRHKWPTGAAFFTPTNLLAFPSHDVKAEQQPQQHLQQQQQNRSFEQVLSQKLTLLEQPPIRTQYVVNKKELEDSPFLFNPQEFDCVSPDRQQPQQHQPQQQQPTTGEDLSLEWLMPELYLWGSTTTTTTTTSTATPGLWGQEQQLPASSFYLAEDTGYGGVEETPFFFTDYRTFEPLFSF